MPYPLILTLFLEKIPSHIDIGDTHLFSSEEDESQAPTAWNSHSIIQ